MSKTNRYLMFYVILAVGLAVSWTQVGRRAQLVPDADLYVMSVDGDCQPLQTPCAAYAREFALVLGPDGNRLRLQGEKLPLGAELHMQQFDHSAHELKAPSVSLVRTGLWRVEPVVPYGRLRVNLLLGDQQWVAEYPLTTYQ